MTKLLAAATLLMFPYSFIACSDDGSAPNGSGGTNGTSMTAMGGSGAGLTPNVLGLPMGGEVAQSDLLEVSIDGMMLPLRDVDVTSSVVLSENIVMGLGTTVPATATMPAGDFGISVSVNGRTPGSYPLIREATDVDDEEDPAGHVTVTTTELEFLDPVMGTLTIDTLVLSEPDRLGEMTGSFEGTFRGEDDRRLMITGRFAYR